MSLKIIKANKWLRTNRIRSNGIIVSESFPIKLIVGSCKTFSIRQYATRMAFDYRTINVCSKNIMFVPVIFNLKGISSPQEFSGIFLLGVVKRNVDRAASIPPPTPLVKKWTSLQIIWFWRPFIFFCFSEVFSLISDNSSSKDLLGLCQLTKLLVSQRFFKAWWLVTLTTLFYLFIALWLLWWTTTRKLFIIFINSS